MHVEMRSLQIHTIEYSGIIIEMIGAHYRRVCVYTFHLGITHTIMKCGGTIIMWRRGVHTMNHEVRTQYRDKETQTCKL